MLRHRKGYVASCRVAYRERRAMRSQANRVSIRRSLKVINDRPRTHVISQSESARYLIDRSKGTDRGSFIHWECYGFIGPSMHCLLILLLYRSLIGCFWKILNNAHWCQCRSLDACWCRGHNTSFWTQMSRLPSGSATFSTRYFLG
jgi:hypothetical protein